jgi:cell wall-associated NlpC family hydrolase
MKEGAAGAVLRTVVDRVKIRRMSWSIHHVLALPVLPLLLVLCACSTAPMPVGVTAPADLADWSSTLTPEQAADVSIHAIGLVGTPYRYGGNTPDAGFDCSGLIGYIYQTRVGLAAPRTVAKMQAWGRSVPIEAIRSGDLVLFAQRNEVTHAGIYVGAGRFVHAPSSGGEVRLDHLNARYWAAQQVAFRRP